MHPGRSCASTKNDRKVFPREVILKLRSNGICWNPMRPMKLGDFGGVNNKLLMDVLWMLLMLLLMMLLLEDVSFKHQNGMIGMMMVIPSELRNFTVANEDCSDLSATAKLKNCHRCLSEACTPLTCENCRLPPTDIGITSWRFWMWTMRRMEPWRGILLYLWIQETFFRGNASGGAL